jgi:hypothetical protein
MTEALESVFINLDQGAAAGAATGDGPRRTHDLL